MNHARVVGVPATNCANQQHRGTKVLIDLVKPVSDGAHERRAMEKGEYEVEVVEITIHEVEHEAHFGELEPYVRGLEFGSKPLKIW